MKRAGLVGLLVVAIAVAVWTARRGDDGVSSSVHRRDVRVASAPRRPVAHDAVAAGPAADRSLRLAGRVIGPNEEGIGGAIVLLETLPPRTATAATATTGADGRFAFDRVEQRTYSVFASAGALIAGPIRYTVIAPLRPLVIRVATGGFASVTVVDEARQPIAGAQVDVRGNAPRSTTQTDASGKATLGPLPPGGASIGVHASGHAPAQGAVAPRDDITIVLRRGVPVSGRVVDENHDPIAGARISGPSLTPILSNHRGEFVIPALAPDTYVLWVEDDEHALVRWGPLRVAGIPITGIEIVMKDGGVISGVVLDGSRKPAPFAGIFGGWGATLLATADQAGAFELRGLEHRRWQLRAETPGASSKLLGVDLSDSPQADVELVLDMLGTITGTVVDDRGPVAGIRVTTDTDELETDPEAITDGDGTFRLSGLRDVPVRLTATRPPAGGASWSPRTVTAKVGDRDVRITLIADGQLTGRIAVDGGKAPPRNVMISVENGGGGGMNGDGSFQIKVRPGTYDVVFYSPDFTLFGKRDVLIRPGATTDLGTVTPPQGRTLTGRVVNASGAPVDAAQIDIGVIRLTPVGDRDPTSGFRLYRTVMARRDGTFRVQLPPEPLTAIASDPEYSNSAATTIPGGPGDPPPITLVLSDSDDR